jgi:hypothetical protein
MGTDCYFKFMGLRLTAQRLNSFYGTRMNADEHRFSRQVLEAGRKGAIANTFIPPQIFTDAVLRIRHHSSRLPWP